MKPRLLALLAVTLVYAFGVLLIWAFGVTAGMLGEFLIGIPVGAFVVLPLWIEGRKS